MTEFTITSFSSRVDSGGTVLFTTEELNQIESLAFLTGTVGGKTAEIPVEVHVQNDHTGAVEVPDFFDSGQELTLELRTADATTQLELNSPILTWAQYSLDVADGSGRLFGVNFDAMDGSDTTLTLNGAEGVVCQIDFVVENPYFMTYSLPDSILPGRYTIQISDEEQPDAQTIEVEVGSSTSILIELNVEDFGAVGDGKTDDTQAIQCALDTAKSLLKENANTAGYSVSVNFGPGDFLISDTLFVPGNTEISGNSPETTKISTDGSFLSNTVLNYNRESEGSKISDLTIDTSEDEEILFALRLLDGKSTVIENVAHFGVAKFELMGAENLYVSDSYIEGKGFAIGDAHQVFVDNTHFFHSDSAAPIVSSGAIGVSVQNCTAEPANPDSYVSGRFIVSAFSETGTRNWYIADNETVNLAPRTEGNTGEQILFEFNSHFLSSADPLFDLISASQDWAIFHYDNEPIELSSKDDVVGMTLQISNGIGAGQVRTIVDVDLEENKFYFDTPLSVIPDSSSSIDLGGIAADIVVFGNTLDGREEYVEPETHVASAGVEFYMGASKVYIEDNLFSDLRSGVFLAADMPVSEVTILGNTFSNTRYGVYLIEAEGASEEGYSFTKLVVNGNNFIDTVVGAFSANDTSVSGDTTPMLSGFVFSNTGSTAEDLALHVFGNLTDVDVFGAHASVYWGKGFGIFRNYSGADEFGEIIGTENGDIIRTLYRSSETVTYAGSGDDRVILASGDQCIYAGSGDDVIFQAESIENYSVGSDSIYGGGGNDAVDFRLIEANSAGDRSGIYADLLVGVAYIGIDGVTILSEVECIRGTDFDDILLGSGGQNSIWGGSGDDEIAGDGGSDILKGNAGDDKINGGDGRDEVQGGKGEDTVSGGTGNDLIRGGSGNDCLYGGRGSDEIRGNEGEDWLKGGSGSDTVLGGRGMDTILGGRGNDDLRGGTGNDLIRGGSGNDCLYGGRGSDEIRGNEGEDWLKGGSGSDTVLGGRGMDTILGGRGNDDLRGGSGNDVISGGMGDDVLTGGGNADVFVYRSGWGRDTISDFSEKGRSHDVIDFRGLDSVHDWLDLRNNHAMEMGKDIVFVFGDRELLVLEGVRLVDLGDEHFLF